MNLGVTLTDNRATSICEASAIVKLTLDKGTMTWSEIVDVLPGPSCVEGELVRGSPNNRALMISQFYLIKLPVVEPYHKFYVDSIYGLVACRSGTNSSTETMSRKSGEILALQVGFIADK